MATLFRYFVFFLACPFLFVSQVFADPFYFSTGDPNGLMAVGSRPEGPGVQEIEAADDFVVDLPTTINHATFTGLLTGDVSTSSIQNLSVEIYRVFPKDSQNPPDGRVPTRVNSPSDVMFDSRDSSSSHLTYNASSLGTFTANNSVLNGINPLPNQTTLGEGPVTGDEVLFDVAFTTPFLLPSDHYYFVPQVEVSGGEFFWLSGSRPIVPPGTNFAPDLQSWIRNGNLAPDWLRIGTDIVGSGSYNMTFSLNGETSSVPEPATILLFGAGLTGLFLMRRRFDPKR